VIGGNVKSSVDPRELRNALRPLPLHKRCSRVVHENYGSWHESVGSSFPSPLRGEG
jgi:hypothetical protein